MPRPPLLARVALRLLLSADERACVMSDLAELYERRRARDGERAATEWLRRQWEQYTSRLTLNPRGAWMDNLLLDLRQSARSLARTPVLTATIVLTVGLGIGATTAMFSVIHAVLIRPLPYADAGRLVRIYTDSPPHRWPLSVADYLALEQQQTKFQRVAGYTFSAMTFNQGDVAERVSGRTVTPGYFSLLAVSPLRGRVFDRSDGMPGGARTVVVSYGFAQRHLGGDSAAVGRNIRLDGLDYAVVGVLPRVVGPLEQGMEVFTAAQWATPPRKGPFFIFALGRLRPDTDPALATEELHAINRNIFPIWQSSYQDKEATWGAVDLKSFVIRDVGTRLTTVLGAVAFVLLIACTNAANLLIARVTRRRREALGAKRTRSLSRPVDSASPVGERPPRGRRGGNRRWEWPSAASSC